MRTHRWTYGPCLFILRLPGRNSKIASVRPLIWCKLSTRLNHPPPHPIGAVRNRPPYLTIEGNAYVYFSTCTLSLLHPISWSLYFNRGSTAKQLVRNLRKPPKWLRNIQYRWYSIFTTISLLRLSELVNLLPLCVLALFNDEQENCKHVFKVTLEQILRHATTATVAFLSENASRF